MEAREGEPMAARKKQQSSNWVGLALLGLMGFGIYQFGIVAPREDAPRAVAAAKPAPSTPTSQAGTAPAPLTQPRYVNVADLNVRHLPDTSAPLVMTLPRGTALKVLGRKDGWLLIDINPTLEGWVSEHLTTTRAPQQNPTPPAGLKSSL
jgi:uncharacterized protein YgiM (DUF1202 family)